MAGGEPEEEVSLPVDLRLDLEEVRVLGSLVEKSITTPDYYPLTLNALVAACNQKTSRDPVVSYSEETVRAALERLMDKRLVRRVISSEGGRVDRYRHLYFEGLRLNRARGAALCVLMLRGAQTTGEIRQRTGRLNAFGSLQEVEDTLAELMSADPRPWVTRLARHAGTKEPRYGHLLCGEAMDVGELPETACAGQGSTVGLEERVAQLEDEVATLRQGMEELQVELARFRQQFE
jgi:uncharacterized protein YceH (UPF0502 family)